MTDPLLRRVGFLLEVAERKQDMSSRLGKTAMQKLLYLLQEGCGVPLRYRFDLYTYGPYDSALMRDIDYATRTGMLDVTYHGDMGYDIKPGSNSQALADYRSAIRSEAGDALDSLLHNFGRLTASELELCATLLYIVKDDSALSDDQVIARTQAIKPKFDTPTIAHALQHLRRAGLLQRARA